MQRRVFPGLAMSTGITLSWVGFIVVIPIVFLFVNALSIVPEDFIMAITHPSAIASFRITILYSLLCAGINSVIGTIIAWTLIRYKFFGKAVFDSIVDIPFALPGAVGGIALATVFGKNGIVGALLHKVGIDIVYNQAGILLGLLFITFPFAVRSIQPLVLELDEQEEQAAIMLGAAKWQIFTKIQLPALRPGIASAFILSFARAIGEYGTVIFVAGNIPYKSEVISRYIYSKVDQYDLPGATAVAASLMIVSLVLLSVYNYLHLHRKSKRI